VTGIRSNPFCQTWFNKAVAGVARHYGLESKLRESSLAPDVFYISRMYVFLHRLGQSRSFGDVGSTSRITPESSRMSERSLANGS